MKKGFYLKMAWNGITKNSRLYVPYIMTCIGMIMMYYIIVFLQDASVLKILPKTVTLRMLFGFGSWVIAIFAAIFLFYTNSFLVRRRKKEFGLYNILGMGKKNIGIIQLWETLIITAVSLTAGLVLGVALSKLAEAGIVNMIKGNIDYELTVDGTAIRMTIMVFCVIFALIYLNSLRGLKFSSTITLLNSEKTGEKPPKANWLFGTAGVFILAGAYYLAVSIKNPLSALVWFFVAVVMVIVATYLLFIAGSVMFCCILKKNKKYYYKTNHFVSVSSMVYRMKRNGAGLASICILITMVLVMISASACLYFGTEDSLRMRYPHDITIEFNFIRPEEVREENISGVREEIEEVIKSSGVKTETTEYRYAYITGLMRNGVLQTEVNETESFNADTYNDLCTVYFIPLSDYNRLTGCEEKLASDNAMIYTYRMEYECDTFTIPGGKEFRISKRLDSFMNNGNITMDILPSVVLIVPDFEKDIEVTGNYTGYIMSNIKWYYGVNVDAPDEIQIDMYNRLKQLCIDMSKEKEINYYFCESLAANRDEFYANDGGIFYLGIMLSIVFIVAAVLIIYYKQASEGYEDKARFDIMQKVGMTKKDIRKSINSQMLTVFALPLVMAVLHLGFAFPAIYKLLMLFNLNNLKLLLTTTGISIVILAVLYALVYRLTSNVYFNIVSGKRKN